MKYYSDVLHSLFDTQDALEKAEAEKKEKDDEKVRQKENADKLKAEDKKRFLELRERYFKASVEYEAYFDKLLNNYSFNTIMGWVSEAATKKTQTQTQIKTIDQTAESIFDACKSAKTVKTAKTAREPENLGEILIRIFEDMQ